MKKLIDNRFASYYRKSKAKRVKWSENANAAKERDKEEAGMEQIGLVLIGWSLVAFVTRTWQEGAATMVCGVALIAIKYLRKRVS